MAENASSLRSPEMDPAPRQVGLLSGHLVPGAVKLVQRQRFFLNKVHLKPMQNVTVMSSIDFYPILIINDTMRQ